MEVQYLCCTVSTVHNYHLATVLQTNTQRHRGCYAIDILHIVHHVHTGLATLI